MSDCDLFTPVEVVSSWQEQGESISYWQSFGRRFRSDRSGMLGVAMVACVTLLAIFVPIFSIHEYSEMCTAANRPPCWEFWFGSDELGRDMFVRVWHGARVSLGVAFGAVLANALIGTTYGAVAAIYGGSIDELLMRIVDLMLIIPSELIVFLLIVVCGEGMQTTILALSLTGWMGMARLVRGQLQQLKSAEFVQAAIVLGASKWRIVYRHMIPNTIGPIITACTGSIPRVIYAEAFLSFLGLGVQLPRPSWGAMSHHAMSCFDIYPWRFFIPAACISLTMLGFNLIGDALRDAADPELHR